jgi:hypothetical protein
MNGTALNPARKSPFRTKIPTELKASSAKGVLEEDVANTSKK